MRLATETQGRVDTHMRARVFIFPKILPPEAFFYVPAHHHQFAFPGWNDREISSFMISLVPP